MKNLYGSIAVAVAFTLAIAAAAVAGEAQLKVGDSIEIDGLTVSFEAVPSDGRCPTGLFCFWEGDAACNLWAQADHMERKRLVVHTSSYFGRDATYGGWTIRLMKLDPYPVFERPTAPDSYVVTLSVTRGALLNTEDSTWSRIKALYQ